MRIVRSVKACSYGFLALDGSRQAGKPLRPNLTAYVSKIISSRRCSWVNEAEKRGELEVLLESKLGHCRRSSTILAHTKSRIKFTHTWYSALFSNVSPPARDAQVSMCEPVKLISTWKVFRTSWRSGLLLRAFGQLNRTSLSKRRGSDTVWPPPASGPVDRIPDEQPLAARAPQWWRT